MHFHIRTKVAAQFGTVKEGFTEDLFKALNPPFPPVRLIRFDGSKTGDLVSLELNFLLFKQKWTSEITANHESSGQFFFIDQGKELPFFLKYWKHKHIITPLENGGSAIDDQVEYKTGILLADLLMYPVLLGQFLYRKPIYTRFFKHGNSFHQK